MFTLQEGSDKRNPSRRFISDFFVDLLTTHKALSPYRLHNEAASPLGNLRRHCDGLWGATARLGMDSVPVRIAERLTANIRVLPQEVLEVLVTLTDDTLAVSDSGQNSEVDIFGMVAHVLSKTDRASRVKSYCNLFLFSDILQTGWFSVKATLV